MELSMMLAKVVGLYLLLFGLAILANRKYFAKAVSKFLKNEGTVLIAGAFLLIMSLLLVLNHKVWEGWPVLITIIGWLALLEALAYLFFPAQVHRWKIRMVNRNTWIILSMVSVALGLFLTYQGFLVS